MSEKEFQKLVATSENLRCAAQRFRELRELYPDGVQPFLDKDQLSTMQTLEGRLKKEMEMLGA